MEVKGNRKTAVITKTDREKRNGCDTERSQEIQKNSKFQRATSQSVRNMNYCTSDRKSNFIVHSNKQNRHQMDNNRQNRIKIVQKC